MYIKAVAKSETGLVREGNEDNLFFDTFLMDYINNGTEEMLVSELEKSESPKLFGVFDGLGGYQKGEYAAYITARQAKEAAKALQEFPEKAEMLLKNCCHRSNELVCEERKAAEEQLGTTASMLCFHNDEVVICNIGDTPIYRMREHELKPIFEEHTNRLFFEMMFGKDVVGHNKFPLTQCIGMYPEEMEIKPYCNTEEVVENDIYLICSDGLTDMVSEERIQEILTDMNSEEEALDELVKEALENGGKDNITVILITIN